MIAVGQVVLVLLHDMRRAHDRLAALHFFSGYQTWRLEGVEIFVSDAQC